MQPKRHAEVVGGGFSGLAAAGALAQRGWSVRLHERAPALRPSGAGIYIYENGLRGFEIVSGRRPDGRDGKHQWLRFDDIVVDITADQFDEANQPPVLVDRRSQWHAKLKGRPIASFDDEYYGWIKEDYMQRFTRKMYERIHPNIRP